MRDKEKNPDSPERKIADKVSSLHDEFLQLAPNYARGAWNPKDAIKTNSGSCMAELLYVVGGLLADDLVEEKDIFIGFSKSHGADQSIGFVNKQGKKYAHTTLFITVREGITLGMDFRANRADELPSVQRMREDDLSFEDSYFVGGLEEAIFKYADAVNGEVISTDDLTALHRNTGRESNEIQFNEDF